MKNHAHYWSSGWKILKRRNEAVLGWPNTLKSTKNLTFLTKVYLSVWTYVAVVCPGWYTTSCSGNKQKKSKLNLLMQETWSWPEEWLGREDRLEQPNASLFEHLTFSFVFHVCKFKIQISKVWSLLVDIFGPGFSFSVITTWKAYCEMCPEPFGIGQERNQNKFLQGGKWTM